MARMVGAPSSVLLLSLALCLYPYSGGGETQTKELWAGHQVMFGETRVPFRGRLQTRSDYFVLAEVTKRGAEIEIVQHSCHSNFAEVANVRVSMPGGTLEKLPPAKFSFAVNQSKATAKPWQVGWGKEDLDQDGHPGVSVRIDSTLCSGNLYVANTSTSDATAQITPTGMKGTIQVRVEQTILGADRLCLRWFSKDSNKREKGVFAYERVAPGATCADLLAAGWPVQAKTKPAAGKK